VAHVLAIQKLAHGGGLAAGQTFTIFGGRYRFRCRSYFNLAIQMDGFHAPRDDSGQGCADFPPPPVPSPAIPWCTGFNPSQSPPDGTHSPALPGSLTTRPGVLAFTFVTANVCPHRSSVIFGLLRAPADVVLARHGHHMTVLQHVSIPAALHARGVLVYAPLAGELNEVGVKRHDASGYSTTSSKSADAAHSRRTDDPLDSICFPSRSS
jgi:hypothetical protein